MWMCLGGFRTLPSETFDHVPFLGSVLVLYIYTLLALKTSKIVKCPGGHSCGNDLP